MAALASVLVAATPACAERLLLPVQQGTDISVAAGRAGELVAALAGQLWRLPADGGTAIAITTRDQFAGRPAFSPDGRTLAYQSLRNGHFQIILANADGSNARQVTNDPWHHLAPAWAPDGRRLAIASDRGGDFSVWELDSSSMALTQLTFEPGQELDPAWEPTGRSLAYVSQRADGNALILRNPAQSPRTLISNRGLLRAPAWRPDGTIISVTAVTAQGPRLHMVILSDPPVVKAVSANEAAFAAPATWLDRDRLLYAADGHIHTREFGGQAANEVPFLAELAIETVADVHSRPLPAPDASHPVQGFAGFAVLPDGHIVVSALGDLWELNGDGAIIRALTQDAFFDRDPSASADGRYLAFTSDRDGTAQIWLMDLATRDARRLTAEPGFAAHSAWSSRSDRLAYLAGQAPESRRLSLRLLSPQSGVSMTLADDLTQPATPAWIPGDGQVAIVQRDDGVARLFLFSADGSGTRRRITLPSEVAGPGTTEIQWSDDGKALIVASSSGIRSLPVQDNGMVSAAWEPLTDVPAQLARRQQGSDAVLLIDDSGLARVRKGQAAERVAVALSWQSPRATGRTIVRASRVFDGTGDGYLFNHDVVIEGERIVSVQPWGATPPVDGESVIDARGKTVLPGLVDLSLRLSEASGERLGRTLLAYGITTVQAFGSAASELREVGERWQAHRAGPRLLQARDGCAPAAATNAPPPSVAGGVLYLCPTASDQLASLAAAARESRTVVWSGAWLAAASGQVTAVGPLNGLTFSPADESLAARGMLYQDAVDVLARSSVVVIPSLASQGMPLLVTEQPDLTASRQYQELGDPRELRERSLAWEATRVAEGAWRRSWLRAQQRLLGRLVAGGGRLATASNSPGTPYGLGLHAEIRLLAGAGLKPAQVLRMATAEPARALGLQAEIGTLAAGRRADLLIVDGDPLRELSDLLQVHAVMTEGHLRGAGSLISQGTPALEKFTQSKTAGTGKRARAKR